MDRRSLIILRARFKKTSILIAFPGNDPKTAEQRTIDIHTGSEWANGAEMVLAGAASTAQNAAFTSGTRVADRRTASAKETPRACLGQM